MAKGQFTEDDDELLAELGVEVESKSASSHTPREERIIAGFEEIQRFVEEHARLPEHGEDKDIFERLYAVRLDKIRASNECRDLLSTNDKQGLLTNALNLTEKPFEHLDDDELLSELGIDLTIGSDITQLKHVKSSAEKKAAEEIANRTLCEDFDKFKPLFEAVQKDLNEGRRKTMPFSKDGSVEEGNFFILSGQKAYVASVGEEFIGTDGRKEYRLRVIFDNGVESNQLMRSLQKRLWEDESGRRISDVSYGPLFDDNVEDEDIGSGTIYVLRSKSEHPDIKPHAALLHKIGVTGGSVEKRLANAKLDPTFLMADVEVVATYELYNINRTKLENLLHRFFESARLNVQINDRFGTPISPREWFLVPLFIIDEVVDRIKDKTLSAYRYDPTKVSLVAI
jgi:T5orf172 domain